MIGSLMYTSTSTRPDFAIAVHYPAAMLTTCGAKLILRYLSNLGIKHGRVSNGGELCGFVFADWAGDKETSRSMSGNLFQLSGGAVSWASRRQQLVTRSTTEAEYLAIGEGSDMSVPPFSFHRP